MNNTSTRPTGEVDVVIVGSGAAGLSVAFTAAHHGASVIVLEKGPAIGGTSSKSHGAIWMPNNRFQREAGVTDTKSEALHYLARTSRPAQYDPVLPTLGLGFSDYESLASFYDNAGPALEFFLDKASLLFAMADGFPDYSAQLEEGRAAYTRTLIPQIPDADNPGGTVDGSGATLIDQLAAACASVNVKILPGNRVLGVIKDGDGRVVGVQASDGNEATSFHGRLGVVFASGGFTQNIERRRNFLSGPVLGGCAAITNEGDFLTIAERLGAPLANMNYAWFCPIPLEGILSEDPSVRSIFTPQGDSMLYVNKYGKRTLNEKGPYNEVARTMLRWDQGAREYPDLLQFPIWDQRTVELSAGFGMGNFIPDQSDARWSEVITAATLEELAVGLTERLGKLRPAVGSITLAHDFAEQARRSIERFNAFAAAGSDDDFDRGAAPIDGFFHEMTYDPGKVDVANAAQNTMYPISTEGPYYATILAAGTLDTKGGPSTDLVGRVLDTHGVPIPGLYGVGNCVASASAEGYWGAGGTLGPILTSGWVTGRHLATA